MQMKNLNESRLLEQYGSGETELLNQSYLTILSVFVLLSSIFTQMVRI